MCGGFARLLHAPFNGKMANVIISERGKLIDAEKAIFADKILELRQKGDPWKVIDELVKYWIASAPDEVQAVKMDIADQREMLIDKDFGGTKGGKSMERRFKMLFPTQLMLLIRAVYPHEELKMDQQFYADFARKYPGFKVAEKS